MMKMSNEQLYVWIRYSRKRSGLEVKFENHRGSNFFYSDHGYLLETI